jgi:FtsP/CotA-like multicopper oxidase with cupredoxin domain
LKNELPESAEATAHVHMPAQTGCQGGAMTAAATNLHFHGLSVPPVCHQDETLRTLIQPSDPAFEYHLTIPKDQAPGLYWYHPHPHGHTEEQLLGGASGALIVEGIERANPQLAGLPERVLILRDQRVPGLPESQEDAGPGKDISLNFVPVMYPLNRPAEMPVRPARREFWRVLNASADTYFDLQIRRGPTIQDVSEPQPIELVALDGVAVGSGNRANRAEARTHILLAPGGRAEFIVTTPPAGTVAQLVTLRYDTGRDGAQTPYRVIANMRVRDDAPMPSSILMPAGEGARFVQALEGIKPARLRKLYFSENRQDLKDPTKAAEYFITVDGQTPHPFRMDFKRPDITVAQGTVEDWLIENRTQEAHTFHIHQIHFGVLQRDGQAVKDPALLDTIALPPWQGEGTPYPSVKLRMDFRRKEIVGTFVFHCHIVEHEDAGMMGTIQVVARRAGR